MYLSYLVFRFIAKYGTHIIAGVKMGGRDVIYAKQQHSSPLQPADVQKKLKEIADKIFLDGAVNYASNNGKSKYSEQVFDPPISFIICFLVAELSRLTRVVDFL